jgi:3-hydroxy-3-methylglutaryl CoA synthase
MASITEARPAFVITADQQRRFEGPDTTYQFTELTDFLRRDYRAVVANDRFVIYERNDR